MISVRAESLYFWDILNFAHVLYSPRSCSFVRTTIEYKAAIQTERSKSCSCMEISFIWQDISTKFGMDYCPRQQQQSPIKLLRSDLYRTTLPYKLTHHNHDERSFFTLLCYKKCTWEGFYSFGATGVIVLFFNFNCYNCIYISIKNTLQNTYAKLLSLWLPVRQTKFLKIGHTNIWLS